MSEAYKSSRRRGSGRAAGARGAAASRGRSAAAPDVTATREMRAQGRKTMRRLLDAGMRVFADRGFHAARVDDIVRSARTSHGTFYLYFTNKEDLLRALATECGHELSALADTLGPVGLDAEGYAELRAFLERFFTTYRRYGPVIRAWMEGHVEDRAVSALGVQSFTDIASALGRRMHEAGADGRDASVQALMAMLERYAYFLVSRRLDFDSDAMLDTVTHIVHRGFFGAPLAAA